MAFMMKLAYHLISDFPKLWVQVLKGKYDWDEMIPLTLRCSNVSRLLYGIGQIWEEVKDSICWHVGNWVNTDFWYDHWVDSDGRLVTFYNRNESPRPIAITDMTDANGR
ncbi:hypothetical protein V6N11_073089 [Hibiscus sabdariffa]|uniref:Uncharacterized protein n=1 Tax=Hibiscus sabdariffa TaxID=183260 RepID=A0ABR2P922_9ROSI